MSRAVLGSAALALLTLAVMAPVAMAGNGNGNGQGHGKPEHAGAARGQGQAMKAEKQAKPQKKAKAEKQSTSAGNAKAKSLAMAPCKDGGWQTLQTSDGVPFTNQGRCVSYAVRGGVLAPLVPAEEPAPPAEEPAPPAEEPAAPAGRGRANYLASLPCKDGGWQTQQRADGTRFDNQGHCVSYAVQGGELAAVVPVVTISFVPSEGVEGSCDARATLGDFDLSASYVGVLTVDGLLPGTDVAIATDALGDASVPLGTFLADQVLALTVDEVASGDTTVACPPEVELPEG
jgi:hypothetical protein